MFPHIKISMKTKTFILLILMIVICSVFGYFRYREIQEKEAEQGELKKVQMEEEGLSDASDNGYMTEEQEKALPISGTAWINGDDVLIFTTENYFSSKEDGTWRLGSWYAADGSIQISSFDLPEKLITEYYGDNPYYFENNKLYIFDKEWEYSEDYKKLFKEAASEISDAGYELK